MTREDNQPIGQKGFRFSCHPQVSCYMTCCAKLDLYLYPYDVLRLKNSLRISAADFMHRYTRLAQGSHPYFPAVMLNMTDATGHSCPFLGERGCTIYRDRPSACRTYPLERAVECLGRDQSLTAHYFLTNHAYCQGHGEDKTYTAKKWERDQHLFDYNLMNDLWAHVDALFATNPWQGEGAAGPLQRLAFMTCYDIDGFRAYCQANQLFSQYRLERDRRRRLERDDAELLKFAFAWLLHILGNRPTLTPA